jgi:hypothetical protein
MKKSLPLIVMPFFLFFATGLGCSNKKEDKPIPEIPKDGLKGATPKSVGTSKPLPPSQ